MIARIATSLAVFALAATPAAAACDASNTYAFDFNSQAQANLSYASSYTYTASNPLGATRDFTVSFAATNLSTNHVGGTPGIDLPAIDSWVGSAAGGRTLVIGGIFTGRTPNITAASRTIRVTFTFAAPIRDLVVNGHDVDFTADQYRDWFNVTGSNGTATYTPTVVTPHGTNNGAGPRSDANSSLTLGSASSPFVLTSAQGTGTGASANTGVNTGDIIVTFPQPVTSVTFRYGNHPFVSGETLTGQQWVAFSTLRFCPMPAISVAKTSAPLATTGQDRFNIPLADTVYTITVTNSGGSPVDLSTLGIADLLPAQVSFYNGDFDPASGGPEPFELSAGSSGVSLTTANVAYSNNGGASYTYTPAAGYDSAVNAIRFSPTGSMAANSSFTIRFRARIR